MKNIFLVSVAFMCYAVSFSQQTWQELRDQGANFSEIEEAFNQEWEGKSYERGTGYTLFQRWKHFMEPRVSPSGDIHISPHYTRAFAKQNQFKKSSNQSKSSGDWFPLGYTEWETDSYNPGNGRVNLVVKDPNVAGRYYVGTPSGGLWKTDDNFGSWQPMTDDLPTLGVSGICIDPSNSDVIYLATGDGDGRDTYSNGVLKSEDAGASWQTTGLSHLITTEVRINKLAMHPNDAQTLFAATNSGLWKTTTGGEVWYEVHSGSVNDVEFKPTDPNVMYCCTNRVFKSVNGGDDFENVSEGMPQAGTVNGMELGVSPDEPNYLYALCVDDTNGGFLGLYRSTDSGDNFELRADSPNVLGWSPIGDSDGGQRLYNLALDIDPNNAERLFLGGINVWRSINGGSDFILNSYWVYEPGMNQNYVHADIHYIKYIGNELFVCSDGGIFRSTNGGEDYTDVSAGLQISQFYRFGGYEPNENLLLGGTQDNGSIKYDGNTWVHELGADGMEAAIHPANPDIMYICSQYGNIRKSLNGGQEWTSASVMIDDDGGWVTPYVLHPTEEGTIYSGYTEVWKSYNNGADNEPISNFNLGNEMKDMAISLSNPDVVYACTSSRVYKTSDAGENWSDVASNLSPTDITYVDINPANENDVVVTHSGFVDGRKVYRTLDGGETWENISGNLPNIPVNCVAIDPEDGSLYVGTDLGVYYLDSELLGWIPFNEGLPNVIVTEIEINNSSDLITAATYGRGIWRSSQFQGAEVAPTALFESDKRIICVGDSVAFTDLSFGHEAGWSWTFEGAEEPLSSESAPVITYNQAGFFEVSLTVTNAIGESTQTETAYILVQEAVEVFPYSEGFEEGTELQPYEFTSIPVVGSVNWQVNSTLGATGDQCVWVNNGTLDEPYQTELFSKQFDLTNLGDTVWLSFKYAYAQRHEDNDERLRFFISNNCGQNFQLKDQLRGTQELNTAGATVLDAFIPESWQWETYSFAITGSNLTEAFSFKLRLEGDNGNHLYVDDINLTDIDLNVPELDKTPEIWVYPNPASDVLNVQVNLNQKGNLYLVNQLGEKVKEVENLRFGNNSLLIDVSDFSSGVYYLRIESQQGVSLRTQKVVIH